MKGLSLKQIKQILLEGDSTTLILIAMKNQKQIYFGGSSLGFVLGSSKASPAGFASCSKAVTISNVISTFPYKNKKQHYFIMNRLTLKIMKKGQCLTSTVDQFSRQLNPFNFTQQTKSCSKLTTEPLVNNKETRAVLSLTLN